jgi:hypothetical protein
MACNPKTVQVRFVLPDEFYDDHDIVTQEGWDAVAELMEYGNCELIGVEQ